jgi:hypothetical protein
VTRKALVQPRAWAFGPASLAQPGASVAAGRLFVAIAAIVVRVRRGTGGSRAQEAVADSGWLTQWLWLAGRPSWLTLWPPALPYHVLKC